jgi:hypothetical protein
VRDLYKQHATVARTTADFLAERAEETPHDNDDR